jgi:ribosomal protein S18 acetylase RimI-like enzyme
MSEAELHVRSARRADVPALVDLRVQHLGERVSSEPGARLVPDVRARSEQHMPVWLGEERRVVLVAQEGTADSEHPRLVGYAMGLVTRWPPIFKAQRVGEILELHVLAELRGSGLGQRLAHRLSELLVGRGVQSLRATVPAGQPAAQARLEAEGYRPLHIVMKRPIAMGEA